MGDTMETKYMPPRNRLPTLGEVLARQTAAPVDLFSFYIYMRDQQKSVDYLDFWLDVAQHLSLCRHYVRRLRTSVMEDTPEAKASSKRSSQILDGVNIAGPSGTGEKDNDGLTPEQRLSAFLRYDNGARRHSPANSAGSHESTTPGTERPRPSFMTSLSGSPADNSSPGQAGNPVRREDVRASAEKILYTYLLPSSEREIILPPSILQDITDAIEGPEQRDDPEVFDVAKDYVFQAMERDAFPGFLRSKALGNIVPPSMFLRVVFGLICIFAGFWTAFILLFLDKPRLTRCWEILPFTLGVYFCFTHQYMLDPLLVIAGYSEYTLFSFSRIREPFVKKLLRKRAWIVLGNIILVDAALCSLFIFVPGKRL